MGNAQANAATDQPEITLADGSKYRGERSSKGQPHGQGRLQLANGDRYEGSLKNGLRDGIGVYSWQSGEQFEGECFAGFRDGFGALWNKDGKLVQCGRWDDDKLVASCAVPLRLLPNGKFLSAAALKVKRDHPNDSALMPDGTHYIGELNERGQPDGQGATFHPNGSPEVTLLVDPADASQSGRWVDGKLQGQATAIHANGDRYDGMFKDDLRDGLGVYSRQNGSRFECEFAAGKFTGLGAAWDNDGKLDKCGRWVDSKLVASCAVPLRLLPNGKFLSAAALKVKRDHPNDSALMPDGTHYIGELNERGQPHGEGTIFHPDGKPAITLLVDAADASNSGRWIDGKLNGRATMIHVNGDRYDGLFKDDARDGLGVYSWKDGTRYEGECDAGFRYGFGALWNKDGKLVQCGRWLRDVLVLSWPVHVRCIPDGHNLSAAAQSARLSHPDTTLQLPGGGHYIGSFDADTLGLHGAGVEFDSAGVEIRRGEWRKGSFHSGSGLLLSSDGQSRYVGLVRNGRKHGRGTLIDLRSGSVIEADWIDGLAAAGAYVAADGSRFEGELSSPPHLPHGFGVRQTVQGAIECGEFAEGALIRSCEVLCSKLTIRTLVPPQADLFYPDRSWYAGDLIAGRPHGRGVKFDAADAEVSNGEWIDGDFTKGKMRCADGDYNGAVQDGRRHGRGMLTLHSGATIDAVWSEGRAASGAFMAADNSRFEGELLLNRPHGLGVRWSTQDVMLECGEFIEGSLRRSCVVRCSLLPFRKFVAKDATLLYPDHRYYSGAINAANQRHGHGTLFRESGTEEASGEWFEDRLHGEGRCQWTKGRSYRGHFVFGALTGLGQFRYPNGDVFEGEFVNGKKFGFGLKWNEEGVMIECGVYSAGFLKRQRLKTGPVPRSKLLYGERLSELARTASLLFSDGSCFVGPLNAQLQPHGVGKRYDAIGVLNAAGLWANGALAQSALVSLPSQLTALVSPAPPAAAAPDPRRWALVFGNSQYQPAAVGDTVPAAMPSVELSALNMIDCLRALKFKVVHCRNGTQLQMKHAIKTLVSQLRSGDLVFLYFIGHGALVDRETYLLPTDIGSDPVSRYGLSVQWIKNKISRRCRLHHCERLTVVMALDCCRTERVEILSSEDSGADSEDLTHREVSVEREEDPASESEQSEVYSRTSVSRTIRARESRSARTRELAQCNRLKQNEWFIMFATEAYLQTWTDRELAFFTRALLQYLPEAGLEIKTMFTRVNAELVEKGQQTAHCETTMHKDLFLAGQLQPPPVNPASATQLASTSPASVGSRM